ncbi:hypothetical protein ACFX4I_25605 [Peribacillus sp. YIM B13472]|uniref:hypothetical protein n=1 Tax=Peribacillus sp. YIM B13472 TaxID=3366297 RepID=UPI00366B1A96
MKKNIMLLYKWLVALIAGETVLHFIECFGTAYSWSMPANKLVAFFFGYLGVKVLLLLLLIGALYWGVLAIARWHQNSVDKAVEKHLTKVTK